MSSLAAISAGIWAKGRRVRRVAPLLIALVVLAVVLAHPEVPAGAHDGSHGCNHDRIPQAANERPASLLDPKSTADAPSKVQNPEIPANGHGNRCLIVDWDPPATTGSVGVALTGYHMQWRDWDNRISDEEWHVGHETIRVEDLADPSNPRFVIMGLFNGRLYEIRIQACNANLACGQWHDRIFDTPRTTPRRPDTPTVQAGDGKLDFTWTSADNRGAENCDYTIQWGKTEFSEVGSHVETIRSPCPKPRTHPSESRVNRDEPRTTRTYTVSNLTNGQTYWVRVQARNYEGDSLWSYSAWGTPQTVITAPGVVMGVSITDVTSSAFTVNWAVPSNGGAAITHFTVNWETGLTSQTVSVMGPQGTAPPTATTIGDDTNEDVERDVAYTVKVRACNAPTRCGAWSDDERVSTSRITGLVLTPGNYELTASWNPVGAPSGTRAISVDYQVQHQRASGSTWPQDTDLDSGAVIDRTSYRIGGLANNTEYSVRVRPIFDGLLASDSTTGSSDRSAQDGRIYGAWSMRSAITRRQFRPPMNLSLTPISDREVRLSWTLPNVEVVNSSIKIRPHGSSTWYGFASVGDKRTYHDFDLNDFFNASDDLSQYVSFAFHVIAVGRAGYDSSTPSAPVIMIDTPILDVDGRTSGSEFTLQWDAIDGVLNDQSYSGGEYHFRVRELEHSLVSHKHWQWAPDSYTNGHTYLRRPSTSSTRYTDRLPIPTLDRIYAVQISYHQSGRPSVYAARNVYVWPSTALATPNSRVAGYPLNHRQATPEFRYRICEGTFPSDALAAWRNLIVQGVSQWENSVNAWGAIPNVVTTTFESETYELPGGLIGVRSRPCAHYEQFVSLVEIQMPSKLPASEAEQMQLATDIRRYIESLRSMNVLIPELNQARTLEQVQATDAGWNEIMMENDQWAEGLNLAAIGVFGGEESLAGDLGVSWCWEKSNYAACAVPSAGIGGSTTDIFIRQSLYTNPTPALDIPGGRTVIERADVEFEYCEGSDYRAYRTVVHEVGHALGIAAIDDVDPRFVASLGAVNSHPSHRYSSLSSGYYKPALSHCAPSMFDVFAIRVLYRQYVGS